MSKATAVVLVIACFAMAALLLGALVGVLRAPLRSLGLMGASRGESATSVGRAASGSVATTSTGATAIGNLNSGALDSGAGDGEAAEHRGAGATSVVLRRRLEQRRVERQRQDDPTAHESGAAASDGRDIAVSEDETPTTGASADEEPTALLAAHDTEAAEPTRPVERQEVPEMPAEDVGSRIRRLADRVRNVPDRVRSASDDRDPMPPSDPDRASDHTTTDGE